MPTSRSPAVNWLLTCSPRNVAWWWLVGWQTTGAKLDVSPALWAQVGRCIDGTRSLASLTGRVISEASMVGAWMVSSDRCSGLWPGVPLPMQPNAAWISGAHIGIWSRSSRPAGAAEDIELTTKAAARLVFMNLLSVSTFLRSSRDVSRWWIAILLPAGAQGQPCQHLCRELSDQAFRKVGSTFATVQTYNAICEASRRYYLVRPHLPLAQNKQGMTTMRDALIGSSARALLELADLGFSTLGDDDPLIVMIQSEASNPRDA